MRTRTRTKVIQNNNNNNNNIENNKTGLIWFRNDLRVHDHEPLALAAKSCSSVFGYYCFDRRMFVNINERSFVKTGSRRTQFIRECVNELRGSFRSLGSELIIRHGNPEEQVVDLIEKLGITDVFYHEEVTQEEVDAENAMKTVLEKNNVRMHPVWGITLYHLRDLRWEDQHKIPSVYAPFRNGCRQHSHVRHCFNTPDTIPMQQHDLLEHLPDHIRGDVPSFETLGLSAPPRLDPRAAIEHRGGEHAAYQRLQEYFTADKLGRYDETRSGMVGKDYSSKLAPWLAQGCISPRYVYWKLHDLKYKLPSSKMKSADSYEQEIIWRDFFKYVALRFGNKFFHSGGIKQRTYSWSKDEKAFDAWTLGMTGVPIIDSNMRELYNTGWMSNRGRMIVSSFLTKNLNIDWRWGAMWFEHCLLDYDVCSNWGNWAWVAGVGTDRNAHRTFNISRQSVRFDPDAEHVLLWVPELDGVPMSCIHEPWLMHDDELERLGLMYGEDYPKPILNPDWKSYCKRPKTTMGMKRTRR